MDIDYPTEVGPTEETVHTLIEYLVGPLLPLKNSSIANETPSEAQQESVAKQVQAVVVLYNYIHQNHHKESQFLNFDQFCYLAIMFQPSILHYMKYMCQSKRPVLVDPESQLSLTEKAIMDACIMSETLLNPSNDMSNIIKDWSITKVAVLLVDLKKENCFLNFNNGVWSVIEKDIYTESEKHKRMMIDYDEEGEAGFQMLAFSAVKEATANVNGELKVLERHVVYSLSQAKTATLFYIVQSTQSLSKDDMVSIQDAICSLHGPVVKESLGSWVVTPVVEYYYLLPYAEIISKWLSRVSNSIQKSCEKASGKYKEVNADLQIKSKLDSKSVHVSNSSQDEPPDCIFTKNISKSNHSSNDLVSSWLIGCPFDQKVKETVSSTDSIINVASVGTQEDMNTSCRIANNENPTDLKKMSTISQSNDEIVVCENMSYMVSPNVDRTPTMDSKKSELSEAAIRALLNKRQKLSYQQEVIEGELTICDKKIQAIMHGGIGDCLGLKLEAQLTLNKACKELDDICLSNNWMLPIYQTSLSDDGVVANVTVKGTNFECSFASGILLSIHEARNSAATHAIKRLHHMASELNTTLVYFKML